MSLSVLVLVEIFAPVFVGESPEVFPDDLDSGMSFVVASGIASAT